MDMTLLYVEDDTATREQLKELFALKIKRVHSAKDGKEALDIFKKHKIDFIISDYNMPNMNGNELCQAVKAEKPHIPFILLTAFHDTELLIESIEVGVDKFLQKPINSKKLFKVLEDTYQKIKNKFNLEKAIVYLQEAEKIALLSYWSADILTKKIEFSQETRELFSQSLDLKIKIECEELLRRVMPEDKERFMKIFQKDIYIKNIDTIFSILSPNNQKVYIHMVTKKWTSSICRGEHIVGVFQDITSYEKQKITLLNSAHSDPMLHIYNKGFMLAELESLIRYSNRSEDTIGAIFFDIDNFKHINDNFGHIFADEILLDLALLVQNNIRHSDLFGRWGGDEFIIIMTHHSSESIKMLMNKLNKIIATYTWKNHIPLTVSMGLAFYEAGMNAQELISKADFKMFEAKKDGKNRCEF